MEGLGVSHECGVSKGKLLQLVVVALEVCVGGTNDGSGGGGWHIRQHPLCMHVSELYSGCWLHFQALCAWDQVDSSLLCCTRV